MVLVAAFRHRHCEQQIYGFTVNCIERNGFLQTDKRSLDILTALDAAMRNGNTISQAGAAQAFPGTEALKNFSFAQIFTVICQFFADGFQQALLAVAVHVAMYTFRTEQVT